MKSYEENTPFEIKITQIFIFYFILNLSTITSIKSPFLKKYHHQFYLLNLEFC